MFPILLCNAYVERPKLRHTDIQHLREMVTLSSKLQKISLDEQELRLNIAKKETDLEHSKQILLQYTKELTHTKQELQLAKTELSEYDTALRAKEQQLAEKIDQNETVIKLLHQSEMEEDAEEVINTIRQCAIGKRRMTTYDWKQLYHAVDLQWPTLKSRMIKELGTFTEQQMQVCYLMRIGLSKSQIQGVTNLSRTTIWRWFKRFQWAAALDHNTTTQKGAQ